MSMPLWWSEATFKVKGKYDSKPVVPVLTGTFPSFVYVCVCCDFVEQISPKFWQTFLFQIVFFSLPPPPPPPNCWYNAILYNASCFKKWRDVYIFSFQFSTAVITITIAAINIIFNITLPFAANASFDLHQVWCQLTFAAKTETCCATSHNCIYSWFTCMVLFVMSAVSLFLEYKHLLNWITEREREII